MAYNSTIDQKQTECIDCAAKGDHSLKPTISKRCQTHYWAHRKLMSKQKKQIRGLVAPEVTLKSALDIWFDVRMKTLPAKCENCGAEMPELLLEKNKMKWKSCQAHLLPKRHFKSVQANLLNGMVLGSGFSGMCPCHDYFDHDWDTASQMKIWPEVVRRFKILYPLIKPEEHQYIPEILLKTLENA